MEDQSAKITSLEERVDHLENIVTGVITAVLIIILGAMVVCYHLK